MTGRKGGGETNERVECEIDNEAIGYDKRGWRREGR